MSIILSWERLAKDADWLASSHRESSAAFLTSVKQTTVSAQNKMSAQTKVGKNNTRTVSAQTTVSAQNKMSAQTKVSKNERTFSERAHDTPRLPTIS
jgi:hypothetical protein